MNLKHKIKGWMLKAGSIIHANDESKVIYYHDIHSDHRYTDMSTNIELFSAHLDILKREGYRVVPCIENFEKEIEITFDDGFRGIYENFEFFLDHKIPMRVFLISGFIGKKGYMQKHEIEELLSTELFRIGSHTVSHENLDGMDKKSIEYELQNSKKTLEDMFGIAVDTLCYPRGKFTDEVIELAKAAGYEKQYTCLPGAYNKSFKEGLMNRSLVQHADEKEFLYILEGGDRLFRPRYIRSHYRQEKMV